MRVALLVILVTAVQPAGAAPLEEIRKTGTLRLCAHPAALPYSNRSAPDGRPGFQVELAEAIAHAMDLHLTVAWTQLPANATRCDASMDMIASATPYAPEGITGPLTGNAIPLRLSKPYASAGFVLAVPSGSPAHRFADLGTQKIGVIVGSVAHEYLAKKGLNVSVFAFSDEIIAAIETGEIGAGAIPSPIISWYRHEHPHTIVTTPEGYEPEPALSWNVAIGLWRADDALIDAANTAIDKVIAERSPQRIYASYGIAYHPPFADTGNGAH
jgi:ABC-type amino acid transport substrate-binding protein